MALVSRRDWLFGLAAWGVGCGPSWPDAGQPPKAPPVYDPTALIPPELDVVVRVELGRLWRALGENQVAALRAGVLGAGRLWDPAEVPLEQARLAWFAWRPGPALEPLDHVLVLSGSFVGFSPNPEIWRALGELGGPWRRHERRAKARRGEPTLVLMRADDIVVFVTAAAQDSVERLLERGADAAALQPHARGLVSAVVRPRVFADALRVRAPWTARLLASASDARLVAETLAGSLIVSVRLRFQAEAEADRAASSLKQLTEESLRRYPVGVALRSWELTARGPEVVGRFELGG